MELIDTHCHLDSAKFTGIVPALLDRARSAGVQTIIIPGVREKWWPNLYALCLEHTGLFAAPGLHPLFIKDHKPGHLDKLIELCEKKKVIAIGEIGLDFFDSSVDRETQQKLFEEQLHIASKAHLPILLHVRKAHDQVLACLRKKNFSNGGIVHAFSGSFQQANQYIQLGFGIGIGGNITYPRAKKIRNLAAKLPQANLVLETDAPDMSGAAHRGEINLPEYLIENLEMLAIIRGEKTEYTAKYTTGNTKRILGL